MDTDRMRIVVTGSTGLIGSQLVPALRAEGHHVLRLVRRAALAADEIAWDPAAQQIVGDDEANAWQKRPQRAPYVIQG